MKQNTTSASPVKQPDKQACCTSLAKAIHEEGSAVRYIALTAALRAQVMDMFVEQTHNIDTQMRDGEKPMRFTDTRLDEQERGVSLKMVPMSLVMEGTSGKSYLMNLIDTPGVPPGAMVTSTGAAFAQVSEARYRAHVQQPFGAAHIWCWTGEALGGSSAWWVLISGHSAADEDVNVAMRPVASVLRVLEVCCMGHHDGPGTRL